MRLAAAPRSGLLFTYALLRLGESGAWSLRDVVALVGRIPRTRTRGARVQGPTSCGGATAATSRERMSANTTTTTSHASVDRLLGVALCEAAPSLFAGWRRSRWRGCPVSTLHREDRPCADRCGRGSGIALVQPTVDEQFAQGPLPLTGRRTISGVGTERARAGHGARPAGVVCGVPLGGHRGNGRTAAG